MNHTPETLDVENLRLRLAQAEQYCLAHLAGCGRSLLDAVLQVDREPEALPDLTSLLRSHALEPKGGDWEGAMSLYPVYFNYLNDTLNTAQPYLDNIPWRQEMVDNVVSRRAPLVDTASALNAHREPDAEAGRLLAFTPDHTLSDGAAAVETGWLLDDYDAPPWDTWVIYVAADTPGGYDPTWRRRYLSGEISVDPKIFADNYLIAWIPNDLVPLVQKGMEVTIATPLKWLDELKSPFADRLRTEGLLGSLRERSY